MADPSINGRLPIEEHTQRVDYTARAARITDVDRLVALGGEPLRAAGIGQLNAADMLRQLVFLPHASVLVAERRREIVGGAVLAIRPSVQAGGYVGTIDLLVLDPSSDGDSVTQLLIDEALRSAANKGCTSVEVRQPSDPIERTRWLDRGFEEQGPVLGRAVAPAMAGRSAR